MDRFPIATLMLAWFLGGTLVGALVMFVLMRTWL